MDLCQDHIIAISKILEVLRKCNFLSNFKKYRFYKDEINFLGYVVLK